MGLESLLISRHSLPWAAGVLMGTALLALTTHGLLFGGLAAIGRRMPALRILDGALLRHGRGPAALLLPLLAVDLALPATAPALSPRGLAVARHTLFVLWVIAAAWLLIALTGVLKEVIERRFHLDTENNVRARQIRTQTSLLRDVLIVGVVVFSLATVMLRFEGFRTLGAGLLASASVVGVVVGIASQRPLGNLLAGLEIALSQPIRVDDVVVVEDEWGKIEEITLTYAVVRIWDERRLVLPISYFMEKPFQNWTRSTADVLGTVFLRVDHTAPLDELRTELERVVRASAHWDGRVCLLQMTEAGERSIELRALVSASDADASWDLRCEVREKLVGFLQRHHPGALPRVRAELAPQAAA